MCQSGDTGLTRANETPAEPHAPDTTPAATAPSTVPTHGPPDEADPPEPAVIPEPFPPPDEGDPPEPAIVPENRSEQ